MRSGPRVSIITPSYNQGAYIERTLRSVLEQDYAALEHIVIDGGSQDATCAILARYAAAHPGRLFWTSQPDGGQADAANTGFRVATGAILGWVNSDDTYQPAAIQRVVEFFARHHDVDLVYGDACHIDENDELIAWYPTEPFDARRLLETCFICQPAVFFRNHVFRSIGPLDTRLNYCMDYDYWLRASRRCRIAYLRQHLDNSRLHAGTKTSVACVDVHREILETLRSHVQRVPARWISAYASASIAQRLMPAISGLHKDSWAAPHIRLRLRGTSTPDVLRIEGTVPRFLLPLTLRISRGKDLLCESIITGQHFCITAALRDSPPMDVQVRADRRFTPGERLLGGDVRQLSYRVRGIELLDATGRAVSLYTVAVSRIFLVAYCVLFFWTSLRVNRRVSFPELRRKVRTLRGIFRMNALVRKRLWL